MVEAQQQDLAEQTRPLHKMNPEAIQELIAEAPTTLKTKAKQEHIHRQEPKIAVALTPLAQALQEVEVVATAAVVAEDRLEAAAEVAEVKMYK